MEENGIASKPKQWGLQVRDFWHDTSLEMKKVTWPARHEVIGTTLIVIAATIVFAVYLWGCDVLFFQAIDFLFRKFGASV